MPNQIELPASERNKESSLTAVANDASNFSEYIDVPPQKNLFVAYLKKNAASGI